jgi:succinoglycan biosynthesis protein ExoA
MLLAPIGMLYPPLALPAAIWAAVCLSYGAVIGARERQVCASAAGAAAMIMHLAWSCGFFTELLRQTAGSARRSASGSTQ